MISRRRLLQLGGMAGAAVLLPFKWNIRKAYASPVLTKFGLDQALPGLGPTGIPVLTPTSTAGGIDTYKIVMGQFKQKLHPILGDTTLWGYAQDVSNPNHRYLGGAIVAKRGRPVKLIARNNLPPNHILPVDPTIPGAETTQAQNRAAIHLHGGLVPWTSDGGPFSWFLPNGTGGPSFLNGGPSPGQATYYYPNDQSARLVWYHDHAVGITRLNAYAGLASAYIIRDDYEQWLINAKLIPSREIPLIIQDKSFNDDGSLFYTREYDAEVGENAQYPLPNPSVVPEFFGDTILVNGMAYPYLEVEPRIYRFRMLNGAQARFFNLQLYYADSSHTETDLTKPGPKMIQIGTEGGFLPFPVALNDPPIRIGFDPATGNANAYTLLLAPAERADVLIDFSGCNVGSKLILYNDAPSPFPGGDPPISGPGAGPDTRTLMQFRVISRQGLPDPLSLKIIPAAAVKAERFLGTVNSSLLPVVTKIEKRFAVHTRDLTLNEAFDNYGRLIQFLGTNVINPDGSFGLPYEEAPTETPTAGTVEIWRIFNLTADVHPIHFHLVNVQVLSRQPFNVGAYDGTPVFTGPARRPDLNEMGWKETVRMNPGEMTEVIMKFDLPKVSVPLSNRTGVSGHEYVWHCHILEHEEHDMMRPLIVKP